MRIDNNWVFLAKGGKKDSDDNIPQESGDIIEMKMRGAADINMYLAKRRFDRPPYYKKFMKGGEYYG